VADDTIVAPATAPGESAVAIARLSGPAALTLAARHFRGKRSPEKSPSHRILFGEFLAGDGTPVDTVLLSVFRAPRSYTGEDVVEISSHGGGAIPRAIIDALLASGARPARPGEFTERAFRNGKLDLAQAEAVAALVRARSERSARAARSALGGELTRRVGALDDAMVALLADVEARIDFPNDVGERIDGAALACACGGIAERISAWLDRIPSARRRDEGVRVALVGRPNVGKSSLLNALVGHDRAIVSEIPGTTRDTIESSIWLDGVEIRLLDTAGLRGSEDSIERIGVERAERALAEADLAILVLDRSNDAEEEVGWATRAVGVESRRPVVVAWNKADLARSSDVRGGGNSAAAAAGGAGGAGNAENVAVAAAVVAPAPRAAAVAAAPRVAGALAEVETIAIRPRGVDSLIGALKEALPRVLEDAAGDESPTTSARQESLLSEALSALRRAQASLEADVSYDLIAVDLTDARRALGEIVGRGVGRDVVAEIFARFCIGK